LVCTKSQGWHREENLLQDFDDPIQRPRIRNLEEDMTKSGAEEGLDKLGKCSPATDI
jgi:hypothetical protein